MTYFVVVVGGGGGAGGRGGEGAGREEEGGGEDGVGVAVEAFCPGRLSTLPKTICFCGLLYTPLLLPLRSLPHCLLTLHFQCILRCAARD